MSNGKGATSPKRPRFKSKHFVCEKCGKKLIERKDNGVWHFAYGRRMDEQGNVTGRAPVEMYIYGSVKIRCLFKECDHWNVLNFFPFNYVSIPKEEKKLAPSDSK